MINKENNKIEEVIRESLKKLKLDKKEISEIKKFSKELIDEIKNRIKKNDISAEPFIGGSVAKNTLVKKESTDIDIFIRFDKKYSEEEIKKNMRKILRFFKLKNKRVKISVIKGSREYYIVKFKDENKIVEIVPVYKIRNPEEAKNTTDLSYFHVKYINKKILGNPKIIDEVIIAKSFCYAQGVYGAESYIRGLSGYAVELMIIKYGSFINMLEEIIKSKEKIIIDIEKKYKNREEITNNINSEKLKSPIIIIDPTFKSRNVASSLSDETFLKLKEAAINFLKSPKIDFFELKKLDINKMEREAYENNAHLIKLEIFTKKQSGDIAGTKM
ncbi:MAG: nucleotidyltransferase domain-containing protein, partial [Candidatus Pacearchaeota archaeon]